MRITTFEYINKMGVELEGGWDIKPDGLKSDCSVSISGVNYRGEVCSRPNTTLNRLITWITENHPTKANGSCGLHVHVSLKSDLDYLRLTDKSFYDYFLDSFNQWGMKNCPDHVEFWSRFHGFNGYCLKRLQPHKQINDQDKSGFRYTQLNFCKALHGTLEVRMLPMFEDKDLTISAVCKLAEIIESYLDRDYPLDPINYVDGLSKEDLDKDIVDNEDIDLVYTISSDENVDEELASFV